MHGPDALQRAGVIHHPDVSECYHQNVWMMVPYQDQAGSSGAGHSMLQMCCMKGKCSWCTAAVGSRSRVNKVSLQLLSEVTCMNCAMSGQCPCCCCSCCCCCLLFGSVTVPSGASLLPPPAGLCWRAEYPSLVGAIVSDCFKCINSWKDTICLTLKQGNCTHVSSHEEDRDRKRNASHRFLIAIAFIHHYKLAIVRNSLDLCRVVLTIRTVQG